MPTLIIALPTSLPSAAVACAAVWSDGATVLRHTEAPLAQLATPDGGDTVVMVP